MVNTSRKCTASVMRPRIVRIAISQKQPAFPNFPLLSRIGSTPAPDLPLRASLRTAADCRGPCTAAVHAGAVAPLGT